MSIIEMLETILIGPLKLVFEIIYVLANRIIGHPGLSIIVLSLIMNILVLPLYRRADDMQEKAKDIEAKLHDGVAHIKKTFSGDERMMILQTYYRQNNYKPTDALNGSVSLLLEVPFFMAAYHQDVRRTGSFVPPPSLYVNVVFMVPCMNMAYSPDFMKPGTSAIPAVCPKIPLSAERKQA
jgi:membrane protein insertase Oxa1/YidC/SpoIIIJ